MQPEFANCNLEENLKGNEINGWQGRIYPGSNLNIFLPVFAKFTSRTNLIKTKLSEKIIGKSLKI